MNLDSKITQNSNIFNKKISKNFLQQSTELGNNQRISPLKSRGNLVRRKSKMGEYLNPFDEEIEKIARELKLSKRRNAEIDNNKLLGLVEEDTITIENMINEDNFLLNIYETKMTFFDMICFILKKNNKKIIENEILKIYFLRIEKLVILFKPLNLSLNYMMSKLVGHIKYEKISKDNILFKEGDRGDKFYIILKGEVGILIQKEKAINCTFIEFIKSLIILYLYQEKSLIVKLILNNRESLRFDERSFLTLMDTYKFYHFYKEYTILKRPYKDISDFIHMEKKIGNYIYKKNNFSIHDSLITLKFQNNTAESLYKFYCRMVKEIQSNFDSELGNVENITKLRINLNNPVNLTEFGLYVKSHENDEKKFKTTEFFDKLYSLNEISTSYIYECDVHNYIRRLSFEEIIVQIQNDAKEHFNQSYEDKSNFKFCNYIEVNHLKDGNIFGELALINPSKKRTATIIIKEDCHLGVLNKEVYDLSIKSAQDKLRIRSVFYFLNGPIFNGISNNFFLNNFFFRFKKRSFNSGEILFNRGETRNKVYFIIKGELQLRTKLTLKKITEMIEYLNEGKYLDDGGLSKKYCRENFQFKKYYEEVRNPLKIYVLKDREISGLDDMTKNNIYLFDCVCVSSESTEVFELDYKIYESALEEMTIKKNNNDYVSMKKEILVSRLYEQRDSISKNEYSRIREFPKSNSDTSEKNEDKSIDINIKTMNCFFSVNNINYNKKLFSFLEDNKSLNNINNETTNLNSAKRFPILKNTRNLSSYMDINKSKTSQNNNLLKTDNFESTNTLSMKNTKKKVKLKGNNITIQKDKSIVLLQMNKERFMKKDNSIKFLNPPKNHNLKRIGTNIINQIKKSNFSLPKSNKRLMRPLNEKFLKSQIKKIKKSITPSSNLLMKEFTKRYIEPIVTPYQKNKFIFDNQKLFEPLLESKTIDGKKFMNIAIKTSIDTIPKNENMKESIIKEKVFNNKSIFENENSNSSKRNKKYNISTVRSKININIDKKLEENYKDIFLIDCLCLDKWEENINKHLKKEKGKLKGKKVNNIKYI